MLTPLSERIPDRETLRGLRQRHLDWIEHRRAQLADITFRLVSAGHRQLPSHGSCYDACHRQSIFWPTHVATFCRPPKSDRVQVRAMLSPIAETVTGSVLVSMFNTRLQACLSA